MTTFNTLPPQEQDRILANVERNYEWKDVYSIRVDLKEGKLCSYCLEPRDKCICEKESKNYEI